MKLLGNFDLFREYYDIVENKFYSFETLQKTGGVYKIVESKMIGLFVENNNLYFLNGEEKFLIKETHIVLLKAKSTLEKEFILIDEKNVLVRFLYSTIDSNLNVAPFEYIDEEDFRWEAFIAKIINNEERKRNFVLNLMKSHLC